jgi:16S rRNA (cytidine1402-2'-O)-methyltransferase
MTARQMTQPPEPALKPGLYIVATPIGNLGDMSFRGVATLRGVAAVACEDTRVTGRLFKHLGLAKRLIRYDDHADEKARARLLELAENEAVALVSDAGTPLISDPGYRLVRAARERGITVTSVPGASAAIVGLTLAGLPTDRFLFAGFLPAKDKARRATLQELGAVQATLVFYESGPRLVAALEAVGEMLPGREVAVARELTKLYEECRTGPAETLAEHYRAAPPKGEIVLLIGPPVDQPAALDADAIDALLVAALKTAKPSRAAADLARSHGLDRKALYARALVLRA